MKTRKYLLESIEQVVLPMLKQYVPQQDAQRCMEAMVRLRKAVMVKDLLTQRRPIPDALAAEVSVDKISDIALLCFDGMLEIPLSQNEPLSLKELLIQLNLFKTVEATLSQAKKYPLSKITSEKLCELAAQGDLNAIIEANVSQHRINQVVGSGVVSAPATFLGYYNALMIAIAHRQTAVVKYFVENKKARLDINGGRGNDITMQAAAGKLYFFHTIDLELQTYINELLKAPKDTLEEKDVELQAEKCQPVLEPSRRTYRDALMQTFMKPSIDEETGLVRLEADLPNETALNW